MGERRKRKSNLLILSPAEKEIWNKFGEAGLLIYKLIDGQKTAKEILRNTALEESKLIEILDFMDERGMINLAFPAGTPPDLCLRESMRIQQLADQLTTPFSDFENFNVHTKAEWANHILGSVPVKNAVKTLEDLKPRNKLDIQSLSAPLQAASLIAYRKSLEEYLKKGNMPPSQLDETAMAIFRHRETYTLLQQLPLQYKFRFDDLFLQIMFTGSHNERNEGSRELAKILSLRHVSEGKIVDFILLCMASGDSIKKLLEEGDVVHANELSASMISGQVYATDGIFFQMRKWGYDRFVNEESARFIDYQKTLWERMASDIPPQFPLDISQRLKDISESATAISKGKMDSRYGSRLEEEIQLMNLRAYKKSLDEYVKRYPEK